MQKPISISIDTTNDCSVAKYENIRKGDTLLMTIKLFQGSQSIELTGQTLHIILRKPDGYSVEKTANGITGNNLTVAFDVQATLAIGEVIGEVQILDNGGTSISNWFTFEVKPTLGDDIVIKSTDQIETLGQIIALINSYNANADNLAIQNQLALTNKNDLTILNDTANGLITTIQTDIATGETLHTTLQNDFTIGNVLDLALKQDIANGNLTYNNLLTAILNGNETITGLQGANWAEIQSMIGLLEIVVSGLRLTDENNNYLTDENGNYLTL